MDINEAVTQVLPGLTITGTVAADQIDQQNETDALLARGAAAHVLRRHQDQPSYVLETNKGYVVAGDGVAVLVEQGGRIQTVDLPAAYIEECACGGCGGGKSGKQQGGVVNGDDGFPEPTLEDLREWVNVLLDIDEVQIRDRDVREFDSAVESKDAERALRVAAKMTRRAGITQADAEEIAETNFASMSRSHFARPGVTHNPAAPSTYKPHGAAGMPRFGGAARKEHSLHKAVRKIFGGVRKMALRGIHRINKIARANAAYAPKPFGGMREQQVSVDEVRDFVHTVLAPELTEAHGELIVQFDAASSISDKEAMLIAAAALTKAAGVSDERVEMLTEAVLAASPKHKARAGVLGAAVRDALRNAGRRGKEQPKIDREAFEHAFDELQEWLASDVASALPDEGRVKMADAFDAAVAEADYDLAVDIASKAAEDAARSLADAPTRVRELLEYRRMATTGRNNFIRSLKHQSSFERATNKLRRLSYKQHRSQILRRVRVYRKRYGAKLTQTRKMRGESVEGYDDGQEVLLTMPEAMAEHIRAMVEEAGIPCEEEVFGEGVTFAMDEEFADTIVDYLEDAIDEEEATRRIDEAKRKHGPLGKHAVRHTQGKGGKVTTAREQLPEPRAPRKQPTPTGPNGAVGGGVRGEITKQPTPTGPGTSEGSEGYTTHGEPSSGYMTVKHNGKHIGHVSQMKKHAWKAVIGHKTVVSTAANHHLAIDAVKNAHKVVASAVAHGTGESQGDTVSTPDDLDAVLDQYVDEADAAAEDGGVYYVVYDLEADEPLVVDEEAYGQYLDGDRYITVYATEDDQPNLVAVDRIAEVLFGEAASGYYAPDKVPAAKKWTLGMVARALKGYRGQLDQGPVSSKVRSYIIDVIDHLSDLKNASPKPSAGLKKATDLGYAVRLAARTPLGKTDMDAPGTANLSKAVDALLSHLDGLEEAEASGKHSVREDASEFPVIVSGDGLDLDDLKSMADDNDGEYEGPESGSGGYEFTFSAQGDADSFAADVADAYPDADVSQDDPDEDDESVAEDAIVAAGVTEESLLAAIESGPDDEESMVENVFRSALRKVKNRVKLGAMKYIVNKVVAHSQRRGAPIIPKLARLYRTLNSPKRYAALKMHAWAESGSA